MSRVLVKSGGFSTQLAKHVSDKIDGDPLWGSRFDKENPQAVIQTHLDFLKNGADIIVTNTYQSSVEGFMKHLNLTREESIECMRTSVKLTRKARDIHLKELAQTNVNVEPQPQPLIMGSIGPYGAMLHDGSEYSGSYAEKVTPTQIQNWHRTRIDAVVEEGVDGLAVETIPCQMEAEAVTAMLLKDYPHVKFWVSFQCKDGLHLAHGESFANATLSIWKQIQAAKATDRIYGIGVNCVNPKFVTPLFKSLHHACPVTESLPPLLVYSNSGETYDTVKGEWTGCDKCVPLETYVPEWLSFGAKIIGGCCRVYPHDILRLKTLITNLK